jgi:IS30 family transposase
MSYRQITSGERYTLCAMRRQGYSVKQIAETLGRHRSTIYRELERNSSGYDGAYRPSKAQKRANVVAEMAFGKAKTVRASRTA